MPSATLRVGDAAKFLALSTGTVYALVNEGKIDHHRIGSGRGSIRFSQEQLDAYNASTLKPAVTSRPPAPIPYQPKGLKHVQPRAPRSAKRKGG